MQFFLLLFATATCVFFGYEVSVTTRQEFSQHGNLVTLQNIVMRHIGIKRQVIHKHFVMFCLTLSEENLFASNIFLRVCGMCNLLLFVKACDKNFNRTAGGCNNILRFNQRRKAMESSVQANSVSYLDTGKKIAINSTTVKQKNN